MDKVFLTDGEIGEIRSILQRIQTEYQCVEDEAFLKDACLYAHLLPWRLRQCLNSFKLMESGNGVMMISGYPVHDEKIGATPAHWNERRVPSPALDEEMLLILFGCLLGEPLAWATQQNGYIVHDVLPIKSHEDEQLGTGSKQTLYWHNEDAFHPYRGDYLCLLCLRNPDQVATTYVSIDAVEIGEGPRKILFEPRFTIRPDESHLPKNHAAGGSPQAPGAEVQAMAYERINRLNESPQKIAVLFGDPASPYVRIDPYFMDPLEDEEAQSALDTLVNAMESKLSEVAVAPGDFLFIDNYKAVHGRQPFRARYDGRDRWLKRINVARDMRKSRDARLHTYSHVIL